MLIFIRVSSLRRTSATHRTIQPSHSDSVCHQAKSLYSHRFYQAECGRKELLGDAFLERYRTGAAISAKQEEDARRQTPGRNTSLVQGFVEAEDQNHGVGMQLAR